MTLISGTPFSACGGIRRKRCVFHLLRTEPKDVAMPKISFVGSYAIVGELVLLATALDHQLNRVLIQVLHLGETPMLEAVIATLDTVRKIEMLRARSKYIGQTTWQKAVASYASALEDVSKWRNIACHTPLIPDDTHGAVFAPTAVAKLLKGLQLGKELTAKRIPIGDVKAAIPRAEAALGIGENLIMNFARVNTERKKRLGVD